MKNIRGKIKLAILFGSRTTGLTHSKSDVDILVKMKKKKEENFESMNELEELFQKKFPKGAIDIAFYSHVNPLLLKKVLESGHLLIGSKKDFLDFKMHTFFQYCDFQPYLRLEKNTLYHRINAYR